MGTEVHDSSQEINITMMEIAYVSSNNGWSGLVSDLLAHWGYPSSLTQYASSSCPHGTQPLNVSSSTYAEFLSLSLSGGQHDRAA